MQGLTLHSAGLFFKFCLHSKEIQGYLLFLHYTVLGPTDETGFAIFGHFLIGFFGGSRLSNDATGAEVAVRYSEVDVSKILCSCVCG